MGQAKEGSVAAAKDERQHAPEIVERFVRQLVVASKAVALYPPSSTIPRETAEECVGVLREILREVPEVRLAVGKAGLFYEDTRVFPGQQAIDAFAYEFYLRKLADVRFHVGVEGRDLIAFLTVLKYTPEEVDAAGGFEARLWEQGVSTITVTEVQLTLVEVNVGSGSATVLPADALQPPTRDRKAIDEALAAAFGGRHADQVTIARIIGDPDAVREYIEGTYEAVEGGEDLAAAGERFSELAQLASEIGGEEQHELFHSLAAAVWGMEPKLRRDLMVEEILPEARNSGALSGVVRQMDIEEVCRLLVEGTAEGDTSKDGLVRALRNLTLISLADREEIVSAAGAAMVGAGMAQSEVSEVLELAAPSRLQFRTTMPAPAHVRPEETILKLIDLAPGRQKVMEIDEGVSALLHEARRGITDGDVIGALVSMVGYDARPAQFASTMSMLEDSLDLLIARGEIEAAADTAAALVEAAKNPLLSPEQRQRLEQAIDRFARPNDIRELARALRVYPPGTPEHEAAKRLVDTLGSQAIKPLLEHLADEPDMSARKSLVDLLSGMAPHHISQMGAYVTDQRWYFVRNVVAILGATRSSASLMYLERTLRYPDPRVRRETIRGLSGINDRLASEMLIAALGDDEAQNVQLAARYLGQGGTRGAISALELVARGEGRGNRENGPRVEAIEALGLLGATEALPTLETLAGKRALLGAGKVRELRAASESAIAAIKAGGRAR